MSVMILTACQAQDKLISKPNPKKIVSSISVKESLSFDSIEIEDHLNQRKMIQLADVGFPEQGDEQELDQERIIQFAKELAGEIDTPMRNPSLSESGDVTEGTNRLILAEDELVDMMLELSPRTKKLTLPIYETEPTVTIEELAGIDEYERASFHTYFDGSVDGRVNNIQLSAEAINNYVLGPGDQFSFNKVVGERTVERGYEEALEIVNKEFVLGIGGGICQTSSTLFNAIDQAGLEVIQRYSHSREVGYVPSGRDATVSWGGPDFVFKNPFDYPVILRAEVLDQTMRVKVFSHHP
ncbi:vancomycin resistance protein [Alkalicoccobacillus porphyridii]|uniref:Vancomycin resistance protein n=2 Tax=Alkalicoccobacillus porphyridii TaxID=2597270 RepID=A0A554A0F0_9BACI|nr:vancomycin resistance protein [Alkalicoccobacillus porphyridii]